MRVAHNGDIFGETSLLTGSPSQATIISASYCDMYFLEESVFKLLLELYPADRDAIVNSTLDFLKMGEVSKNK